uniref:C2H2-type domain-containing protein n=1 Tax=Lepeophtheirus salmonis TaxID=72036 RepID=A0A0K2SVL7_LEPSM
MDVPRVQSTRKRAASITHPAQIDEKISRHEYSINDSNPLNNNCAFRQCKVFLDYAWNYMDQSSDIELICHNGVVKTHCLVLALISNEFVHLLRPFFKNMEESLCIYVERIDSESLRNALMDIYLYQDMERFREVWRDDKNANSEPFLFHDIHSSSGFILEPVNESALSLAQSSVFQDILAVPVRYKSVELLKEVQCWFCSSGSIHKKQLVKHLDTKHKDLHLFICHLCGDKFDSALKMRNHRRSCYDLDFSTLPKSLLTCSPEDFLAMESQYGNVLGKHYVCPGCDTPFKGRKSLGFHLEANLSNCLWKIQRNISLASSLSSFHSKKCPHCPESFPLGEQLENHISLYHEFKCRYCEEAFKCSVTLRFHELNNHKSNIFFCEVCSICLQSESEMYEHKYKCDPKFPSKDHIYKSYPASCEFENCTEGGPFSILLIDELTNHYKDKHNELRKPIASSSVSDPDKKQNKEYFCIICKIYLKSKFTLVTHWKKQHLGRYFKCEVCLECFTVSVNLKKHLSVVHKIYTSSKPSQDPMDESDTKRLNLSSTQFSCPHCDASFPSHRLFLVHRRRHHIRIQYSCSICNEAFSSRQAIVNHKLTCEKGFPCQSLSSDFVCQAPLCYKSFPELCLIDNHWEGSHMSSITDFSKCVICAKPTKGRKDFKVHVMKVHHNYNYTCKLCGKKYEQSTNLRQHWNVSHLGLSLSCAFCKESCTDLRQVYKHLLMKHMSPNYKASRDICDVCGDILEYWDALSEHKRRKHSSKTGFSGKEEPIDDCSGEDHELEGFSL